MKQFIKASGICALLLLPLYLWAQQIQADTVFPYKLLSTSVKGRLLLLSGNTETAYRVHSAVIANKLRRAIQNKDQVIVHFRSRTSQITSLRIVELTAETKFVRQYHSLTLKGFKFNPQHSLIQNEMQFTDTLANHQVLLKKLIPADSIPILFKYFAGLQCDSPSQCSKENPCISFDYKKNGCNARAHWIRKILSEKFGYDCQKVFVEGNLVVTNDGSCFPGCVYWGWHVAVYLTAVDQKGNQVGWVIDPSLFTAPCSMADWAAEQAKSCDGDTGTPEHPFLRPSYIYTPNGSTDNDYSCTRTLLYRYCKNCHR